MFIYGAPCAGMMGFCNMGSVVGALTMRIVSSQVTITEGMHSLRSLPFEVAGVWVNMLPNTGDP